MSPPGPPRLLVVAAGPLQLPLIARAQEMGLEVVATDQNPQAPGLTAADHAAVISARDAEGMTALARRFQVGGILCEQTDAGVLTVAMVAERLGLPGIGRATALAATDKWLMRERCSAAGIAGPRYRRVATLDEAQVAAAEVGYPVIIKPTDGQSSRGVRKVTSPAALAAAWSESATTSGNGVLLIEELMIGLESSVEAIVDGGRVHVLGISRKEKSHPPSSFDLRLTYPGAFSDEDLARLAEIHAQVVHALGISSGLTHGEYMVTDGGVKLIEVAARGCGARVTTSLLPAMTGLDVVGLRIRQAMGWPISSLLSGRRRPPRAGLLDFLVLPPGRVLAIHGLADAARVEGVLRIDLSFAAGDRLLAPVDGTGRHGQLLAVADDPAQLAAIADEAWRRLKFDREASAPGASPR